MIDESKINKAARGYCDATYGTLKGEPFIAEGFRQGAQWALKEYLNSLWHDASEEPRNGTSCIVYVSYEFEKYPEYNYCDYTMAVYLGDGFSDYNFPSEANVHTIKWAYLSDILPKEGGGE